MSAGACAGHYNEGMSCRERHCVATAHQPLASPDHRPALASARDDVHGRLCGHRQVCHRPREVAYHRGRHVRHRDRLQAVHGDLPPADATHRGFTRRQDGDQAQAALAVLAAASSGHRSARTHVRGHLGYPRPHRTLVSSPPTPTAPSRACGRSGGSNSLTIAKSTPSAFYYVLRKKRPISTYKCSSAYRSII